MSKKNKYLLFGAAILIFIFFIIMFYVLRHMWVIKQGETMRHFAKEKKYTVAMDFLIKEYERGSSEAAIINEFCENLIHLSFGRLEEIFLEALDNNPKYKDELNAMWAWVIYKKGDCPEALNKISNIIVPAHRLLVKVKEEILGACKQGGSQ